MTASERDGHNVRIVIVGASLAGMTVAQALRRGGHAGALTVVGAETARPYDRPPLSKEFLTGDVDLDRLTLAPARPDADLDLDLRLGRRAVALDLEAATLSIEPARPDAEPVAGEPTSVGYDALVIATGSRARTLPPSVIDDAAGSTGGVNGLVTLRTLDDARRLKAALGETGGPVVVCGAGFIGGEVVASARMLGREVVLVEAASAPLTRVLDPEAGMVTADLHRQHGVTVHLDTTVESVHVAGGRVNGVSLSTGVTVDTELVVVGIGAVPNVEWLSDSGLSIDDGLVVDRWCRAAPGVVAAGDVARFPNERYQGRLMRLEQWDNAVEMGRFAASTLLADLGIGDGADRSGDDGDGQSRDGFAPVPWFWSDQYDRKIQLAGLGGSEATMAQGTFDDHRFVRIYHSDGRVTGVLAWNRPRQAIIGRRLIEQGATLSDALDRLGG